MTRWWIQIFWAVIIMAAAFYLPFWAAADDISICKAGIQASPSSIWANHVGGGFRKGAVNAGVTAGAGFGFKAFGGIENHDLALAFGHFGRMLTGVTFRNKWYGGNLEFWGELFGGAQINLKSRYVVGITAGPRYNFITDSRWVPFLDLGAGISGTDIAEPDLSTTFQFNIQTGVGTHYFFGEDIALTLQIRGVHLSNAQIEQPNYGTNTVLLLFGVAWFF